MHHKIIGASILLASLSPSPSAYKSNAHQQREEQLPSLVEIIAHRGSSATQPEESEAAYRDAIAAGATLLECDLQVTRDLRLICSHDPIVSEITTDICDLRHRSTFPIDGRRQAEVVDGFEGAASLILSGWFIADYTLDQLQQVRLCQRFLERSHEVDGRYTFTTLDALLDLVGETGLETGVYIEIKHSTWYLRQQGGVHVPSLLYRTLCERGLCEDGRVYIESFLLQDLEYMHKRKAPFKLVPLTFYAGGNAPYGLLYDAESGMATQPNIPQLLSMEVEALGLDKRLILDNPSLVHTLHSVYEMRVHVWTLRNEASLSTALHKEGDLACGSCSNRNSTLGTYSNAVRMQRNLDYRFGNDPYSEMEFFIDLGVDGVFTDNPASLKKYLQRCNRVFLS